MTFNTFQNILDKFPETLTQIAFGIGDLDANQELWEMFSYCRKKNIIPNITINGTGLNEEMASNLVKYCGAVAISHYEDEICFNGVKLLTDKGLKQVNIHKLVAKETIESCYSLLEATKNDSRLEKLNAIILLGLKKKGERNNFNILPYSDFRELIKHALDNKIRIGFDSCSANKFMEAIKDNSEYEIYKMMSEPCESSCFSLYINVEGIAFPCSFLEGEPICEGINILSVKDFFKDIWYNERIDNFRRNLLKINRNCPYFKI